MSESANSEGEIREYLLGRVSDEAALERIEELLFTDEEFCSRVALAEDGLVNDYVLGQLEEADAESFRATLAGDTERRLKLELTQALRRKALALRAKTAQAPEEDGTTFFDKLAAFFRRPVYAGAFALLLAAVLASAVYLFRGGRTDELAELRDIYKQGRPTEARISDFGYAPPAQLRGAAAAQPEKNRLRRIQNGLIEATEKNPGARTHQALGAFQLTQREYDDAIREFEIALKFDGRDAKIHNDLGTAFYESAMASSGEKRFANLARALEEFTTATELDSNSLEPLFNRSLALEQSGQPRQAKESWALYLQKDPSSPWADEARKHLARINDEQTRFKTDDGQVLRDFLDARRGRDEAAALKIHDATKGLLKGAAVPLQLSRRYLEARRRGDEAEAREGLDALAFIGRSERERHSDFFFLSWPTSTRTSGPTRSGRC
jgi:tetratricopeptide (TPR) repeat protein